MKKITLYTLFTFISIASFSQNDLTKKELYYNIYKPEDVIDSIYGITIYEKLNPRLGGDSTRHGNDGHAAEGFIMDYYTNDQLLHKGYYEKGQLKLYKNFYPNGNVERNFRQIDLKKSKMILYYPDGKIKSEITYIDDQPLKWTDYYPNGNPEYYEENNKTFEYYIKQISYYENGAPKKSLELNNKKKLEYTETEYYPNGKIKAQGMVIFNRAVYDYQRKGKWLYYDENGVPVKEEFYANGVLEKEKDLK
jgi:antitoxin component YwqK of YwqJK toxin-antitoxin module